MNMKDRLEKMKNTHKNDNMEVGEELFDITSEHGKTKAHNNRFDKKLDDSDMKIWNSIQR